MNWIARMGLVIVFFSMNVYAQENVTLAIIPFAISSEMGPEANKIRIALCKEFSENGRFTLFEPALVDSLMKEQGFTSETKCSDEQCLFIFGKLFAADRIVGGSCSQKRDNIFVDLKYLNATENKVIKSISYNFKQNDKIEIVSRDIVKMLLSDPSKNIPSSRSSQKSSESSSFKSKGLIIATSAALVGGGILTYFLSKKQPEKSEEDVVDLDGIPQRPTR